MFAYNATKTLREGLRYTVDLRSFGDLLPAHLLSHGTPHTNSFTATFLCRMRWWLLLPFPITVLAQAPEVPQDRKWAPSAEQAMAALSCGWDTHHVNEVMSGSRLKPAYADITGVVYSTHGDSTLASVGSYTQGRRSGAWYTLDARERVAQVVDYFPDSSQLTYWYDELGRLTEFCHGQYFAEDTFDRIFGGGGPGQCWVLDKEQRLVQSYGTDPQDRLVRTWYYPTGQLAARIISNDTAYTSEQWCPSGKRIGFLKVVSDGASSVINMDGRLVLWSVADQAYYLQAVRGGRHKLRKLPWGRWRRYGEREALERQKELRLQDVTYDDPERPVHLPCHLPRQ